MFPAHTFRIIDTAGRTQEIPVAADTVHEAWHTVIDVIASGATDHNGNTTSLATHTALAYVGVKLWTLPQTT